jgi:hypothetical protein
MSLDSSPSGLGARILLCLVILLVALPGTSQSVVGIWYVDDGDPDGVWGSTTPRRELMYDGASSDCETVYLYPDSNFSAITPECLGEYVGFNFTAILYLNNVVDLAVPHTILTKLYLVLASGPTVPIGADTTNFHYSEFQPMGVRFDFGVMPQSTMGNKLLIEIDYNGPADDTQIYWDGSAGCNTALYAYKDGFIDDRVVCEYSSGTQPIHPSTYWYDVTPGGSRKDFHVRTPDSDPTHYTNFTEPSGWTHSLHQVGGEWWVSWWDASGANPIDSLDTFRFQFDNPKHRTWGDWNTTLAGISDPHAQVADSSATHVQQVDGFGRHVHVPYMPPPVEGYQIRQSLPGVWKSDAAWGDIDNDGDLDLVLCGESDAGRVTRTYKNNAGTLSLFQSLTDIDNEGSGCLAWGDFDLDGDLDLAMAGNSSAGRIARIYENNGSGTLTWDTTQSLTGVVGASTAWGDFDLDGDLDLVVTGHNGTIPVSVLYENDPPGRLLPDPHNSLIGLSYGSACWADWDGDGDPDLLLTGTDGTDRRTILYRNDEGFLTDTGSHGLPSVALSDAAWGDFDNDGDLDLAFTGETSGATRYAAIYRNGGSGDFTLVTNLMLIYRSSCAWGDYDDDGDLDVLFCGYTGGDLATRLYDNVGGSFVQKDFWFPGVREGSLRWADVDLDGDLEFLLTGADWGTKHADLYERIGGGPNTPPSAPPDLVGLWTPNGLLLQWDGAADYETPATGLYYAVRVGTTAGGNDVLSGTYGSPLMGNVGQAEQVNLRVLQGTYYWSVRAIDSGFLGSNWSAVQVATSDQYVDILPVDDAFVDNGNPNTAYGVALPNVLYVGDRSWGSGNISRTYFKFDLPVLPPGAIVCAELHAFCYSTGIWDMPLIDVFKEGNDVWSESTITWNNAPTAFASQATSWVPVFPLGWCVWEITPDVVAEIQGDGSLTEVLRSQIPAEGTPMCLTAFYSSEYVERPGYKPFLRIWSAGVTGVDPPDPAAGTVDGGLDVTLEPNVPNPFSGTTLIPYVLPRGATVRIDFFSVSGELVRRIEGGEQTAGRHVATWDGRDARGRPVPSGIYFYRLEAGGSRVSRRLLLMR